MDYDVSSGRWNRMRRFGSRDYYQRRREMKSQRKAPPYCWVPGTPDPVDKIIDPENLLKAFDLLAASGGPGRGPDGITYRDVTRGGDRAGLTRSFTGDSQWQLSSAAPIVKCADGNALAAIVS